MSHAPDKAEFQLRREQGCRKPLGMSGNLKCYCGDMGLRCRECKDLPPAGFDAEEWRLLQRYNNDVSFHAAVYIYQQIHGLNLSEPTKVYTTTLRRVEMLEAAWRDIAFPGGADA